MRDKKAKIGRIAMACRPTDNNVYCNSNDGVMDGVIYFFRPQVKFAKVMLLHVSVCPQWGGRGACVAGGGMYGGGHV